MNELQVFAITRRIPAGRVLSYGEVGALCEPPISGYVCGRVLGNVTDSVPWWRVVGKNGDLPIRKRNPHLAAEQRAKLESECVKFDESGRVLMDEFRATSQNEAQAKLDFKIESTP